MTRRRGRGHDTGAGGPKSGGLWRGGIVATQTCSGEQLRTHRVRRWEIRGMGRLLTSRGALGRLSGGGDTGRPWVDGDGASAARWRSGEREQ
jgi:hypothetical protein